MLCGLYFVTFLRTLCALKRAYYKYKQVLYLIVAHPNVVVDCNQSGKKHFFQSIILQA